jgi:small subunit ribosomal protein S6
MRKYETVFIANPDLSQEERQPLFDKLDNLISQRQGLLVKFNEWGRKRLAYGVKKQTRGYYVQMEFCGHGPLVGELERNLRLDDRVLKYMTVLLDKEVDVEAVEAEIEAARAAKDEESKAEAAQQEAPSEPGPIEDTDPENQTPDDTSTSSQEEEPANGIL